MRASTILLAVLGFLLGLLLAVGWLSPRLIAWTPESLVNASGRVGMVFNRPVDLELIAAHLKISPHVDGRFTDEDSTIWFKPDEPFGYDQKYTFTLDRGFFLLGSLLPIGSYETQFSVKAPELIYLREEGGRSNIWRHKQGEDPEMLTDEPVGVWDYEVIPGGRDLLISTMDIDGTDDLVLIAEDGRRTTLLDCVEYRCRDGHWQPGGTLVAYERQPLGARNGSPEVWILNNGNGTTRPAYSDELAAKIGFDSLDSQQPRWSSDGRYLSYYKPDARVIIIQPTTDEEPTLIPANLDLMGVWAPDEYQLAYLELVMPLHEDNSEQQENAEVERRVDDTLRSHLIIADISTGEVRDLSDGNSYSDGQPSWDPLSKNLAVGRISAGGGRQIWLANSSNGHWIQLTDDLLENHSGISWSPDGKAVAIMRHKLEQAAPQSGIWLLDPQTGLLSSVAEDAYLPGWLP